MAVWLGVEVVCDSARFFFREHLAFWCVGMYCTNDCANPRGNIADTKCGWIRKSGRNAEIGTHDVTKKRRFFFGHEQINHAFCSNFISFVLYIVSYA